MKIEITRTSDSTYCESCGYSYADGAIVHIDGQESLNLEPHAHCFGGDNYQDADIYKAILTHLGHEVIEQPEA